MSRLVIVTASTNLDRAKPCVESWGSTPVICVANGATVPQDGASPDDATLIISKEYLGTVAAFKVGVDFALANTDADVVACLHDDLILYDPDWAEKVLRKFDQRPQIGLLGFGGAIGVGDAEIYQRPYQPVQLARIGFRSNLVDAEVHGIRSLLAERVACLDGFSQVGRRAFWEGHVASSNWTRDAAGQLTHHKEPRLAGGEPRPWDLLHTLGVVHHAYDGMLGCIAARYGWETWYLPIRAKHLGGCTAVGDPGYQGWAKQQTPHGDQGFWEAAHRIWYDNFKDQLPLRV